jgi:outer membrane protein TolC
LCTTALALALGGCATPPADGGFSPVQQAAQQHLGKDLVWQRTEAERSTIDARVAQLLAQPLSADSAVQLALLNNRGLQARFAELGIGEADMLQASRLPNPGFSFGRMSKGDEREIERGLHVNLARLLAWPLVRPIQQRQLDRTRGAVAADVLALAADTRRAWVQAVAAEETARYRQQVMEAAEASAELARRMAQAGNFNRLQQAREQGFYAEAALNHARAQGQRLATREQLTRLLGLWGAQATGPGSYRLPERLPDLPEQAAERPDIERQAMQTRLDVQGAKLATEVTARNLGLTRTTRFINVLELGLARNTSNEAPVQTGWELSFELPLFDWGGARVARAESVYMQSLHQAAYTAINARSEVRQAYGAYRLAWDVARHHRQELVPLAQAISEENLLRYNGMLIGVFELLADARAQITTVNAAIEALRDYWLAQADLQAALVGKPSLLLAATGPAAAAVGAATADSAPH